MSSGWAGRARRAVTQLLRDAVLTRWCGPRSWPRTVLYTAIVTACALGSEDTAWLTTKVPLGRDGHGIMSLTIALGRVYCDETSSRSPYNVVYALSKTPTDSAVPLSHLLALSAGSVEAYCASLSPFTNNENSLMLLESAMLRMGNRVALDDLGIRFRNFRLSLIVLFGLALLREGASLLLVTCLTLVALDLQRLMQPSHHYTLYPFVVPVVLGSVALYSIARRVAGTSLWRAATAAALLGWYAAFLVNLRSEYLPVVFALHGVFMAAMLWSRHETAAIDRRWLAMALAGPFVGAYVAFQALFIWTLPTTGYNYTYHAVAHPLVLGLAVPPNRLAKAEGIRWSDGAGIPLARRMDPTATYLGVTYERALFAYYVKLWREHPAEMLDIYRAKAMLAGTGATVLAAVDSRWSAVVRWSMAVFGAALPNGVTIFLALLASCGTLLWLTIARGSGLALPLGMVLLVALLVLVQSMVIMPEFLLLYHAPLLFAMAALPLLLSQAALDAIAWYVAISRRRTTVAAPHVVAAGNSQP